MSLEPGAASPGEGRGLTATRRPFSGPIVKAARFVICLGLAAALPLASPGVASAAPKGGHGVHGGHPGHSSPPGQSSLPGQAGRHAISGTITSLTSAGFVLVTSEGATVTVDVSSSTAYHEPGSGSATKADVMAGDKVRVIGTEAATGTFDANLVLIPAVRAVGTVASVGTSSFVLTVTPRHHPLTATATTVTVDVSSATIYREPTVSSPSFADVLAGEKVAVTGTQAGTGTIAATSVMIRLAVRAGRVASLTSGGFTMTTANGVTITVNVSSSTKLREPGVASPSVSVGDQVRVIGTDGGANTLNAVSVLVNRFARHGRHG